jgi:regulator of nonsense transcripts 2
MPTLKAAAQQQMSIGVSSATSTLGQTEEANVYPSGGVWEDDEEQRFYEDLTDLADFIPKSALGIQTSEKGDEELPTDEETKKAIEEAELLDMLNREIYELERAQEGASREASANQGNGYEPVEAEYAFPPHATVIVPRLLTPAYSASPRAATPEDDGNEPDTAAPGNAPSQVLTTLLTRLPNTTTREAIDQAAIDFAFVNSKAARKRLVKVRNFRV